MTFSTQRVFFAMESELEWLPLRDTPGFGGVDIPGVDVKFFGKEEVGPWFYLVRHAPGVVVPRHTHDGDVFHYILEGEWRIGKSSKVFGPGFMQYEQQGLFYGPLISGDQGSLFLAVYDKEPLFIEPPDAQKNVDAAAEYDR